MTLHSGKRFRIEMDNENSKLDESPNQLEKVIKDPAKSTSVDARGPK